MITYKEVNSVYFKEYDSIPMLVNVKSKYVLEKIHGGLGGILLKEVDTEEYVKDLGQYEKATEYEANFDITNWKFFMAFHDEKPIGGTTVVSKTQGVNMLDGREDMSVLWDIRVDDMYKGQGVGQQLFNMAKEWSKEQGFKQMKIECQNNNVHACRFYQKQGAILGKIDEYAYYKYEDVKDEIQFIWYLDL